MSAEDKLSGYASGFASLDASAIAANVTEDFKLLDKNGVIFEKNNLSEHIAELKKAGDKMEITDVVVDGGKAWCKWQVGNIIGAGMISFSADGVSEEQLFYF